MADVARWSFLRPETLYFRRNGCWVMLHNVDAHNVNVTGRVLLNEAAHNVNIRNIKVSKLESHITYSVTKHKYVL
jgi:hypothetical protein